MRDRGTRVAVVTGMHPFDVPAFHRLFRSLPNIDPYIQCMYEFIRTPEEVRDWYDTLVFYNFHQDEPDARTIAAMEHALDSGRGIVLLHHALLAYPKWDLWSEIAAVDEREFGYHPGETVQIQVNSPSHPICSGIDPWIMTDETYTMNEPKGDIEVLLETAHPKSMSAIGWIHNVHNSKIFCFASGHDDTAFSNESFRRTLHNAIHWCGGAE